MDDKYRVLREMLRRPLQGLDDAIRLLREIGFAVLSLAEELASMRDIRASLARIERTVIDFQEDSLQYRQKRIEREKHRNPPEETEADLMSTQDLISKLQERRVRIEHATQNIPTVTALADDSKKTEDQKPNWFVDKVLPYLAGAILLALIQRLLTLTYGGK